MEPSRDPNQSLQALHAVLATGGFEAYGLGWIDIDVHLARYLLANQQRSIRRVTSTKICTYDGVCERDRHVLSSEYNLRQEWDSKDFLH